MTFKISVKPILINFRLPEKKSNKRKTVCKVQVTLEFQYMHRVLRVDYTIQYIVVAFCYLEFLPIFGTLYFHTY